VNSLVTALQIVQADADNSNLCLLH